MCDALAVDKIICLGDVVGYASSAKECVDLVRSRCDVVIQGNHDASIAPPRNSSMRPEAVAALEYSQKILPQEDIDWLLNLPHPQLVDDLFVAAHGSPSNRDAYILDHDSANINLDFMAKEYFGKNICFFGHTHLPMVLAAGGAKTHFTEGGDVQLAYDKVYLVNPGSVGQPRDKTPEACFCIYDTTCDLLTFLRAKYDIKKEQQRIIAAGLPEKSSNRIAIGR